jgi:hypothetical protein
MTRVSTNTRMVHFKSRASRRDLSSPRNPSKILYTIIRDGREWQYHATKGWRNYRLTPDYINA